MNSKMKKRVLSVLIVFAMLMSYAPPIMAVGSIASNFTLDKDNVTCGYNRIYRDIAGSTWISEKPAAPNKDTINITFDAAVGDNYSFKLMNILQNQEIAKVEGIASQEGTNTVALDVLGTTKNGTYQLVGKVGSAEEKAKEVVVNGNLALDATIASKTGGNVVYLKDLTIFNYPSVAPNDITFDLKEKSIINSVDVFSNNVASQGPVELAISYKDQNGEIKKINKQFNNLNWQSYLVNGTDAGYTNPRMKTTLQLDTPITTDQIIVNVVQGVSSTNVIFDEIMVWGYENVGNYNLSLGQNFGDENKENIIALTGQSISDLLNASITVKLMQGENEYASYSDAYSNGSLSCQLKTPNDLKRGTYQIVVKSSDGAINETFSYTVRGIESYESNISNRLVAMSGDSVLNNVFDGDFLTTNNAQTITIWGDKEANNKIYSLRKIKVYADRNSFDSAELLICTHENRAVFASIKNENSLIWQHDDKGDYIDFFVKEHYESHGYQIKLNKTADIKEIEVEGVYFEENLFKNATVTYDGNLFDASNMLDNIVNTNIILPSRGKVLELNFKDGNMYELSKLLISSNFPEAQGLKTAKISYFQDGQWITLDEVTLTYLTGQDQKRQMAVIDLPTIQTTRIRLEGAFNYSWNNGIIAEFNAIGRKIESGKAVAEMIDHIDPIKLATKQVTVNWINEEYPHFVDKYTYKLAKSSDTSIVDLDGKIYRTNEDKKVTLAYEVIDKGGNKFLTSDFEITVGAALSAVSEVQTDKVTAYKNPAMGWVAYIEGFECSVHERYMDGTSTEITNPNAQNKGLCLQVDTLDDVKQYWREVDELIGQGMPINILYIREPWSWFEPTEGDYGWNNPNSVCYALIEGAKERNIQLAFRVLTASSACAQQATPQYVFDAGATGINRSEYVSYKDPYLDNTIFKEKFRTFVNAFGKEFNNEQTAFIDANGHGQWGEMNAHVDIGNGDRASTITELAQYYVDAFPNVLLGGQLGSSGSGGAIQPMFDVNGMNFVIRRDAFGSPIYLPGDAGNITNLRKQGIPLFAENCYHHFDSRDFRWSNQISYPGYGPEDAYGGDDPYATMNDMMKGVVNDAIRLGANTIDLRTLEDCKLWMRDGKDQLDRFTQEGGYRISVYDATYTGALNSGDDLTVRSTWQNNGVGVLPNRNKRWDNKMQVAYALLDKDGKIVQQVIVDPNDFNAGDFEKGNNYLNSYTFKVDETLKNGTYRLATSIVNKRDENKPGVQLANIGEVTNGGWLTLGNVKVGGEESATINTIIEGQGTVTFDKESLIVGQTAIMTVTPAKGYNLSYVEVDGVKVELTDGQYTIQSLPEELNVKAVFKAIDGSKTPIVSTDIKGQGTVSFDKKDLVVGESATMIVTPASGYEVSYVKVNGKKITLKNNQYQFTKLPEKIDIEIEFTKTITINPETPKDTVLTNKDQTVLVSGKLPQGVSLTVRVLSNNEVNTLKDKINKGQPDFLKSAVLQKVLDLKLLLNGNAYSLNGTVKVTLKIDESLKDKYLGIIYIDDNGTITKIDSIRDKDYISFNTAHFSNYAIVSYDNAKEEGVSKPGTVVVPTTNDKSGIVLPIVLMASAVLGVYIVLKKKKEIE